jgi:hypothetical protein
MTAFHEYLCIDPSFFTKKKRIEKLPSILNELKNTNSQIVLPSFLKSFIESEDNLNEKTSNDHEITDMNNFKILQKIDPSLKNENEFFQIAKKARNLLKNFHVTTADKIISRLENNEFSSKHLNEISKFGKSITSTITEFITITSKMKGTIIAYGKKFISLIRKIRIASLEGYSIKKHQMIDYRFAPPMLKILSIVNQTDDFSAFIDAFEITGIPSFNAVVFDFILLIADG